ncbi:hypothetical protein V5F34_18010 [Xanthobacter autotrophicus]|uniref:hypothetical protein n=1 Tax=Xanthobacter autotrophicus TaxID=280 RepID=UPI0037283B07
MSYGDFSAVVLGAAALIVTVIGVFVGVLAVWGYTQMLGAARQAAEAYVESELEGDLGAKILSQTDKHLEQSIMSGAAKSLIESKLSSRTFEGVRPQPFESGMDEADEYGLPRPHGGDIGNG